MDRLPPCKLDIQQVQQALGRCKLLAEPADSDDDCRELFGNLLPLMRESWKNRGGGSALAAAILRASPTEAVLSVASGVSFTLAEQLIGLRLWYWPTGCPPGRRLAILSSRLGRQPDARPDWFQSLRFLCARSAQQGHVLFCVDSTAATPAARRAAVLFGTHRIDLRIAKPQDNLLKWWRAVSDALPGDGHPLCSTLAFLSPPLLPAGNDLQDQLPLADCAAAALADTVVALHVREKGNVHRILSTRLQSASPQVEPSVWLSLSRETARPARDDLLDRGAVGWLVYGDEASGPLPTTTPPGEPEPVLPPRLEVRPLPGQVPMEEEKSSSREAFPGPHEAALLRAICPSSAVHREVAKPWDYLTHCTRRRCGPWPGQSTNAYLDDLILARPAADHSPLAALEHIATAASLVATDVVSRSRQPVVCFTSVPLWELNRLRVFRPHRGRWDFEPFGICIKLDVLQRRGARPVRYASSAEWPTLSADERVFAQRDRSLTSTGNLLDWTVEQEWRHIGDVELASIQPQEAFLFVPHHEQAHQLRKKSRWPVMGLDALPLSG